MLYGVVLELHIELKKMKPSVWRTIQIHKKATFHELHNVIQLLFDWWDAYPFHFINRNEKSFRMKKQHRKNDTRINERHINRNSASTIFLEEYFQQIGDQVYYEYGIKSCWELAITLHSKREPLSKDQAYPRCIEAGNELLHKSKSEEEAVLFPLDRK